MYQLLWWHYLIINYALMAIVYGLVKVWNKKNDDVKVIMASYILSVHACSIMSIVRFFQIDNPLQMFIEMMVLYGITGCLGITAGCHRLWSHKSYKARLPARIIMMVANSIANQGDILHWSTLHRAHHKTSDSDADPHSSKRGLFYSHMGWLLFKKNAEQIKAIKAQDMQDLRDDPVVAFQHKFDPWWNAFCCFILPGIYAYFRFNDALSGVLILGVLRYLVCLHATWCVNSLAHFYGYKPYNKNIPPVESRITSLVAVGEGWHNWHHVYPYDYAAAEHGWLKQWNPTKLWIDGLWCIGQAYDCRRAIHQD